MKILKFCRKHINYVYISIVFLIAFFSYFLNYHEPWAQVYDEAFYLANATRYLNRTVQFEVHPPIGKLFIALGEKIFDFNEGNVLLDQSNGKIVQSENFSFAGYRFFPVLFATLGAVLLFLILRSMVKNNFISLAFTMLYLFDNALIANFRAAMFDSIMVFFSFASILYFLFLFKKKDILRTRNYFCLGLLAGLAVFTKIVALILILLPAVLLFSELIKTDSFNRSFFIKSIAKMAVFIFALCLIGFTAYAVHINLGSKIRQKNAGSASPEYVKLIKSGGIHNPFNLYIPIRDNLMDMVRTQRAIGKLDVCRPNEIGSYPIGWPIGVRSINMVREYDSTTHISRYITMIANPVCWFVGLIAVLLSLALVTSRFVFNLEVKNKELFSYIIIFTLLYAGYMSGVIYGSMHRILYIHLYFFPLCMSFILAFLIFNYLFYEYILAKDRTVYIAVILLCLQIFCVYRYYSPMTYYYPMSYESCKHREWFSFWEVYCEK